MLNSRISIVVLSATLMLGCSSNGFNRSNAHTVSLSNGSDAIAYCKSYSNIFGLVSKLRNSGASEGYAKKTLTKTLGNIKFNNHNEKEYIGNWLGNITSSIYKADKVDPVLLTSKVNQECLAQVSKGA